MKYQTLGCRNTDKGATFEEASDLSAAMSLQSIDIRY